MNTSFFPKYEITELSMLFGRNELMSQLLSLANNKYSVSITGLRRFGKTSVLKCVESILRKSVDSKVYPIFLDFKEVGSIIKGTDNVYKYLVAKFISVLSNDGIFTEPFEFKKVIIDPSKDWEDIFEGLTNVNSVRIQGLFEEVFIFFSELLGKTILLLIDEYEWLFRFSFDQPVGFMKLRNFSSKLPANGVNPLSFWIAGATPWDYLCTLTGSGELNVIDAPSIYLGTINYTSFKEMWNNELVKLENSNALLNDSIQFAYEASGGIPFYGKLIGSYILNNNSLPNFKHFSSFFYELFESLQNEEKEILFEISKTPRNLRNSKFVHELLDKGLILRENNILSIKSLFFKDFVKQTFIDNKVQNFELNKISETQELTDRINTLIMNINNTNKNKRGIYIFEPVVDEAALIKDLRTSCYSLELFSDFSSSLYKIVFERTKDFNSGRDQLKARLPSTFKRNNQFIDIVDIMRHSLGGGHLMDTFTPRQDQMSKAQMLEILVGSKNEPSSPEDFHKLQISTLRLFESELIKLSDIIRALP